MTKSEAIEFIIEHEKWLFATWTLSPEGRDYCEKFKEAIRAIKDQQ